MISHFDHIGNPKSLGALNDQQRTQILRQIQYHIEAPPWEEVDLNGSISLRLNILPGVTRPMSSKGLGKMALELAFII